MAVRTMESGVIHARIGERGGWGMNRFSALSKMPREWEET